MYHNNRGGRGARGGRGRPFNNRRFDNRFKRPDDRSPQPQSKPNNLDQNKTPQSKPTDLNKDKIPQSKQDNGNKNKTTNVSTPIKDTPQKVTPQKVEEIKKTPDVKRQRSRSPISRNNDSGTSKQSVESGHVKYTGRPGERKFGARCRLFIANLPTNMTENEVQGLFDQFGESKEVYFNKDKGFGFIRMDFRINAEAAKHALDKKNHKGRTIQVRFATNASAIELHGLDQYASNELIEKAMSQFGVVEKAVIVCDDRGKSKGYAIIEFEWKKSAQKVIEKFRGEMFVLGRLPKPVFAKPLTQNDEEDGVAEASLERIPGLKEERDFTPRFISPNSFEFQLAQKWKDLYLEEQEKKERLERELDDARYKVELEMEASSQEQDAMRIREELVRRQEELRQIEEDMQQKRQMVYGGNRPSNMNNGGFDNRGPPKRGHMGGPPGGNMQRPGPDQMNMQRHGPRPNMQGGPGILQQNMQQGMLPRCPPPPGIPGMRPPMMQRGPGGPGRDMPPRGGEQHFRPRR